MMRRLRTLAQRRDRLEANIERERTYFRDNLALLRQDLVFVGLGLVASRLLARHRWLRTAALAALTVAAGSRWTAKPKAPQHN
jgi:hypothetical protein